MILAKRTSHGSATLFYFSIIFRGEYKIQNYNYWRTVIIGFLGVIAKLSKPHCFSCLPQFSLSSHILL